MSNHFFPIRIFHFYESFFFRTNVTKSATHQEIPKAKLVLLDSNLHHISDFGHLKLFLILKFPLLGFSQTFTDNCGKKPQKSWQASF